MILTQAQHDALEKAYDILGEHFDGSLLVVDTSVEHGGVEADANQVYWRGGYARAIGLCEIAKKKILAAPDERDKQPNT